MCHPKARYSEQNFFAYVVYKIVHFSTWQENDISSSSEMDTRSGKKFEETINIEAQVKSFHEVGVPRATEKYVCFCPCS